ncbi:MAG: hypothetical protein JNK14_01455 [Chitinophagaceae bacterium]|nr:hypothetical protein [Chitinophagaceae bacterium]
MKLLSFVVILLSLSVVGLSQNEKNGLNSIALSGGRISFGTGDFFGYGINLEYSKQLNPGKSFSKHFSLGAEISFENGDKQPKVINPSAQDFFAKTYYNTTNIVITPKITYHPFNKTFAKGLIITAGISAGYTNQNREFQASYYFDPTTQTSVRRSLLEYINEVIGGYRISAGYECQFKRILAGVRLDFHNYTNGDANTLVALKTGYRF